MPYKDVNKKRECQRRYYQRNKEWINRARMARYREHMDEMRRTRLGVQIGTRHRTVYGLNKRARPDKCELCHKARKLLFYHHWDDSNYSMGIWLCVNCHFFAERVESGQVEQYQGLKERIESEVKAKMLL